MDRPGIYRTTPDDLRLDVPSGMCAHTHGGRTASRGGGESLFRPMNHKASLLCLLSATCIFSSMPLVGLQAGNLEGGIVDTGVGPDPSPYKYNLFLNTGYDTRAATDENGGDAGSAYNDVSVSVSREFGTPRTRGSLSASAGFGYFWDVPSDETDINLSLAASIRHQLTRRLDISFNTIQTYQVEPDFFSGTGRTSRSGQYYYTNNALQLGMAWSRRFSTVTSYSIAATSYEEQIYAAGEDRMEQYFAQEFRYLILPTTTLVAEYRFGMVEYDQNPENSISHFVLGGVDYTANRRLSISLRAGAELREYDNGNSEPSPYGEAILTYAHAEGSSLTWTTRYGFENSEIVGPSTNTTLRTGLQLNQKLTGKLTGRLGIFYQNTAFDSLQPGEPVIDPVTGLELPPPFNPDYSEDLIDVVAGLSYALNSHVSLSLGYNYTNLASDQPANDYDRQRVTFGINLSF